ncbi:MAG: DUF72 domain-containing protein [Bacteroidota bacterium]
MKNANIHIGCSAFYNKEWKTVFYPDELPTKDWFGFYTQQFETFEINATFYRFPTVRVMENWYKKTPENYLLSVKAPKQITHILRFKNVEEIINKFYSNCKNGLKEKLKCVLFQLPPSFKYSPENLSLVIKSLNPEFKNVVEFRHESWWNEEVYLKFSESNIAFCSVSYPSLPEEIIDTATTLFIRLHGNKKLFYSNYNKSYLEELYKKLKQVPYSKEVYIYFNNTASASGVMNALLLQEIINNGD